MIGDSLPSFQFLLAYGRSGFLIFLFCFAALSYVLLVGGANCHRKDFVGRLHRFILRRRRRSLKKKNSGGGLMEKVGLLERAVRWLVPDVVARAVVGVRDYVFYSRNPIFPVLFVVLTTGFTGYGMYCAHLHGEGPYVSGPTHIPIVGAMLCLMVFMYNRVLTVSPGVLTKANEAEYHRHFPCDGVWYFEKRCQVCDVRRPARTKHCYACGFCVVGYDHHCVWINQCVGQNNFRLFVSFLCVLFFCFLYAVLLSTGVIVGDLETAGVFSGVDRHGRPRPLTGAHLLRAVRRIAGIKVTLWLFVCIMFLVVILFVVTNLIIVLRGVTTHETVIGADVSDDIACAKDVVQDMMEIDEEIHAGNTSREPDLRCPVKYYGPGVTEGIIDRVGAATGGVNISALDDVDWADPSAMPLEEVNARFLAVLDCLAQLPSLPPSPFARSYLGNIKAFLFRPQVPQPTFS